MCGLSAYIGPDNFLQELKESTKLISHRGPDGEGFYFNSDAKLNIGLGHRRLSIIDLTDNGAQPMVKDNFAITFVGEIYNYKELRSYCISRGCEFFSETDTEVILSLFKIHGVESFSMLKGMYSFILHNISAQTAFIVRDRMGIKPLYFYKKDNTILFSSEIKGFVPFPFFKKEVCRNSLYEFLSNGFLYEPRTGFKNIFKVGQGQILEINLNDSKLTVNSSIVTDAIMTKDVEEELQKSIYLQTNADVKSGIFFSGGIDSAIIAANAKLPLVFANYEFLNKNIDKFYAKKISSALDQEIKIIDFKPNIYKSHSLVQYVDFVAEHTEEMISDYTFHVTYELSKKVKEDGYTVMLSGAGGDEAFAGYPRYLAVRYKWLLLPLLIPLRYLTYFKFINKRFGKKIYRLISFLEESNSLIAYSRLIGVFSKKELMSFFDDFALKEKNLLSRYKGIVGSHGKPTTDLKEAIKLDKYGFLQHNLVVADKASMLAGIEMRVPLLDESVYKTTYSMSSYKIMGVIKPKKLLKNFLTNILPRNLIYRKKVGFNPPLESLLADLTSEKILEMLDPLKAHLNIDSFRSIIEDHFNSDSDNTYKIWQLMYLSSWLKIHIDSQQNL
jgi:asparagine synthase (glutamine-hydrolysing)